LLPIVNASDDKTLLAVGSLIFGCERRPRGRPLLSGRELTVLSAVGGFAKQTLGAAMEKMGGMPRGYAPSP
jgi:hypothetical protein